MRARDRIHRGRNPLRVLCLSFLVCRANLFSFLLTPLVCYYNILPRPPLLSRAYDVGRTRQDAHGDVDRYDDECDIIASRYTRGLPCGSYLRARHVLARLRRRSVDWKVSERSAPLASHVKVNKQSQLIQQTRRCVSAGFVTCRRRHCPLLGQRPAHQPSEKLLTAVKVRV